MTATPEQQAVEDFLYRSMDVLLGEHHQETYPLTLVQRLRHLNAHGELPPHDVKADALPEWCRHA